MEATHSPPVRTKTHTDKVGNSEVADDMSHYHNSFAMCRGYPADGA
jgi:hypothetical protein